jgi:hypothetical protein
VHVRVDETRCDQLSCRIDRPVHVAGKPPADVNDPITLEHELAVAQ